MSCNGSIEFGFVGVCWLQSLWYAFESLVCLQSSFIIFTPPRWVDYWVQRCWAGPCTIHLVRVINLEASLRSISRQATLCRTLSSPRWWCFSYYEEIVRSSIRWSSCIDVFSKSSLSTLLGWKSSIWTIQIWARSGRGLEFWICGVKRSVSLSAMSTKLRLETTMMTSFAASS